MSVVIQIEWQNMGVFVLARERLSMGIFARKFWAVDTHTFTRSTYKCSVPRQIPVIPLLTGKKINIIGADVKAYFWSSGILRTNAPSAIFQIHTWPLWPPTATN